MGRIVWGIINYHLQAIGWILPNRAHFALVQFDVDLTILSGERVPITIQTLSTNLLLSTKVILYTTLVYTSHLCLVTFITHKGCSNFVSRYDAIRQCHALLVYIRMYTVNND